MNEQYKGQEYLEYANEALYKKFVSGYFFHD